MKKTAMIAVLAGLAAFCFAQTNEVLDSAINASISYVSNLLPNGARVALFKVGAPTEALSRYVTEEFSTRLVNGGKFSVIERNPAVLAGVKTEADYQASGAVSDEAAVSLCGQLGAQVVITGAVTQEGGAYRLNIKVVSVEKAQILGQRVSGLQKEPFLEGLLVTPSAAAANQPAGKPNWIQAPLDYGRAKYEKAGVDGVSQWYYDVGISNKTAAEQTANTRARQNVQANVAANIASEFKARLDVTESSLFKDSEYEDVQRLIETAITNSIKTKVPRYELLETYIETGKDDAGKTWYQVYVLVRFARKDIVGVVESIKPAQAAEAVIKEAVKKGAIPQAAVTAGGTEALVKEIEAVRDYALEGIKEALNGN
jgi:hypothetical protein